MILLFPDGKLSLKNQKWTAVLLGGGVMPFPHIFIGVVSSTSHHHHHHHPAMPTRFILSCHLLNIALCDKNPYLITSANLKAYGITISIGFPPDTDTPGMREEDKARMEHMAPPLCITTTTLTMQKLLRILFSQNVNLIPLIITHTHTSEVGHTY